MRPWLLVVALALVAIEGAAAHAQKAGARSQPVILKVAAGANGKLLLRDGATRLGGLGFTRSGDKITILHVVVEPAFRGQGFAKRLVAHAVDWARRDGLTIDPKCPFAAAEFAKTPAYADVRAK